MNWKLKCLAFHVLNHLPFGRAVHSALQRHVTGRYLQKVTAATLATYGYHVENFRRLGANATALEFGAGRNLLTPLLLSAAGARTVFAFDLDRLATVEQVNDVIRQLRQQLPGNWPDIASLAELLPKYRIDYRAPADARSTGLPERSVDFFCSTSTLEHIPAPDIKAILAECSRVATQRALFSFIVDYHDHYGTADGSIGRFHFYRYDDRQWRRFNPSNHYQNRLRHSEHEQIFAEQGFTSVLARRLIPDWAQAELKQAWVSDRFKAYSEEDLLTTNGHFLLQPPGAAAA